MRDPNSPGTVIKQIGGELGALLSPSRTTPVGPFRDALAGGLWLDSGRGALVALLQWLASTGRVDRVYLPGFICQSVVDAVEYSALPYEVYPVDSGLQVQIDPKPGSATIIVHYFGFANEPRSSLSNDTAEELVIIEDCAQALLTELPEVSRRPYHYRLYSPRKFLGVPAGGSLLGKPIPDVSPSPGETAALWKAWVGRFLKNQYRQLLDGTRHHELEQVYVELMEEFEHFLDEHPEPRALPDAVLQIIRYQDYRTIFTKRRRNYSTLLEAMPSDVKPVFPHLPEGACPLGCPVVIPVSAQRDEVRQRLREEQIFCAVHWPRPRQFVSHESVSHTVLYNRLLTLPVDQRYEPEDMHRIAETLLRVMS